VASRGGSFRVWPGRAPRGRAILCVCQPARAWSHGLVVGVALLVSPALEPDASATPLSRPEVVKLVKKKVQEGRLFTVVRELGIDFKVTPEVADELRGAGASAALIAALQALASGEEGAAAGTAATPGTIPAPAAPPTPLAAPVVVATTPPPSSAGAPTAVTTASPPTSALPSVALPVTVPAGSPAAVAPPAAESPAAVPPSPPAVVPSPSAPVEPPAAVPAGAPASAARTEPEPAEAGEESRPPHPLEPPPAVTLPRGAAETMAALIPGPPPPPPPTIISPFRTPAPVELRPVNAPAPAPAPAAVRIPTTPLAPEPAAETPSRWELVRPLLEKANTLASEGDIRGAQTLVVKAMEIDPGEPKVWKAFKGIEQDLLARAETFLADGQLQRAFREFQFVVTANPDSALGFNGVGLALLSLKNYDEAVAAFEKALTLDPANARYRQALTRAKSLQRASKALERQGQQNLREMIDDQSGRKKGP
jgi:tetratricopeptide repeat protein